MCLTSNTNIPKVAERDIDIYKVVKYYLHKKRVYQQNGKYTYGETVKFNTTYRRVEISELPFRLVAEGTESIVKEGSEEDTFILLPCKSVCEVLGELGEEEHYLISEGFVHAYDKLSAAIENCYFNQLVVKGIIPCGTEYFDGKWDEICAKEMYLQAIIHTDEDIVFEKLKNLGVPIWEMLYEEGS